jgi:hypothetical protein
VIPGSHFVIKSNGFRFLISGIWTFTVIAKFLLTLAYLKKRQTWFIKRYVQSLLNTSWENYVKGRERERERESLLAQKIESTTVN